MPVQGFTAKLSNASILRVYTLRLIYEYCKQLDKDKSISSGLASHCIIVRQKPIPNKTDFGYKQELKTGILKKMHFVYLQKLQDLFAFLYSHIKYLQQNVNSPFNKNFIKSEPTTKASPLFGMLLIENIESYFGDIINYEYMGKKMFIFLKLLKVLDNLMPFNSNICFTYSYTPNYFKYADYLAYIKSQSITCWRVKSNRIQKNGYSYESQWTKKFYQIYQMQDENDEEEQQVQQQKLKQRKTGKNY